MGTTTCPHCWGPTAEQGRCDECHGLVCTRCIEAGAGCLPAALRHIGELVDLVGYPDGAAVATLMELAAAHATVEPRPAGQGSAVSQAPRGGGLTVESPTDDALLAGTLAELKKKAMHTVRKRLEAARSRLRCLIGQVRSREPLPAAAPTVRSACLAIGDLLAQEPSEADDFLAFRRDDIYADHMDSDGRSRDCEDCAEFPRVEFDRFTWLQGKILLITEPFVDEEGPADATGARTADAAPTPDEMAAYEALSDIHGVTEFPDTDDYPSLLAKVNKRLLRIGL